MTDCDHPATVLVTICSPEPSLERVCVCCHTPLTLGVAT